jgi:uncharacterized protein (TIGR02270 family)
LIVAVQLRQFNAALYKEHLEDASFLYDQRMAYLHDPEVNWPDLRDWEDRLEAHIDALVLGGDLAVKICLEQAVASDPGETFAAICVLCRHNLKGAVLGLLDMLDPADTARTHAVSQALCQEAPTPWREELLGLLKSGSRLTALLAHVIGYRRIPAEEPLLEALAKKPAAGMPELAWALGRVGTAASVPALRSLLRDPDGRVMQAAAIALLRLGDDRLLPFIRDAAITQPWARPVLAIGGGPDALPVLLDVIRSGQADRDAVLGLGLVGDLGAVVPLLELLDNDALVDSAAVALNTITGAQLQANVFIPETFDPDELSNSERDAFERDGTVPTRNGEPYGTWQRRALRDKTGWRSWLEQNRQHFSRGLRWRMGKPYGPDGLFDALRAASSPYPIRSATYDELVIRYGLDLPFELELPVSRQRRCLENIQAWVHHDGGAFTQGRWYFARELQA